MEELDRLLNNATDPDTGILHGAAFILIDRSGKTIYKKSSGSSSTDLNNASALDMNSLYWIASMTKFITAIAAVQLIEQGVLDLDSDVRARVEELRDVKVLKGMDSDQPVYEDLEGCTSSPDVVEGERENGAYVLREYGMEGYTHPLLFQPGKSWGYGSGLDWAGVLIERVTGHSLSTYMQENIFSRLGLTSMTFQHPDQHSLNTTRKLSLLEMVHRVPVPTTNSDHKTRADTETNHKTSLRPAPITLNYPLKHPLGGIGLFSTPSDFTSLLSAILRGGNDLFVNGEESVKLLLAPQLGASPELRKAIPAGMGRMMCTVLGLGLGNAAEGEHALAGAVNMNDIPGRRKAGSVCWSGFPNTHWWIDQKTGIAGAFFTQLVPPGDRATTALFIELEKASYKLVDPIIGLGSGRGDGKL
ncbi:beta-lactamase/transpeptidase-like protein [Aspergillus unguis]